MQEIVSWREHFGRDLMPAALTFALLVGAGVAASIFRRLLQRWLDKFELRSRLSHESVLTVTRVATTVLWLVVITLVLEIWGVGLGGIWAVVASVATVIGLGFLATWTMVSNVTASSSSRSGGRFTSAIPWSHPPKISRAASSTAT